MKDRTNLSVIEITIDVLYANVRNSTNTLEGSKEECRGSEYNANERNGGNEIC